MIILVMMMMIGRALPPEAEGDIFGYKYLGQYFCDILCNALVVAKAISYWIHYLIP